jgi:hypothetical protein
MRTSELKTTASKKSTKRSAKKTLRDHEIREIAKKLANACSPTKSGKVKSPQKVIYNGKELSIEEFIKVCATHYKKCDTFVQDFEAVR